MILLAFDSFKGCLSAQEACRAACLGAVKACPGERIVELPLSDGGEGLVSCVEQLLPLRQIKVKVHGPLMEPVEACYAYSTDGRTAYMEMAAASGLTLVPQERRNPLRTTTYGVGEMMVDALRRGCECIVMGIGGSATCDAGQGMLQALEEGGWVQQRCRVVVACDVDNPLYGPQGAAYVFVPQKGATPKQVEELDWQLRLFARRTEQAGVAVPELAHYPGAGAAGGLGYALLAYLKADLRPGIDIVLDLAGFDQLLAEADVVITGEGKSDEQTLMGKVAHGVMKRCQAAGVPVWLLSGAIDDPQGHLAQAFSRVVCINANDHRPMEQLLRPHVAMANLQQTVEQQLRFR